MSALKAILFLASFTLRTNESDITTWLPLEYDLQFTYGQENMKFSEYMMELRAAVDEWSEEKIKGGV